MAKKKVGFVLPQEFEINSETMTAEELDANVNPYMLDAKHANPLASVSPSPKEIPQDFGKEPKLIRVGRPLRHVQYKPVKQWSYVNNQIFPPGPNYTKIKLPLKIGTVIVNVKYFAINPIDLKVWNYYTSDLSGTEKGFGREFSGEVYEVPLGEDNNTGFEAGDKVCGIFYHLSGKGCSASHILIDINKDAMVKVSDLVYSTFNYQKLSCWNFNFVTAFQVLNSVTSGGLNSESTVLINGGSTGTGLMTIQILKNYFHVTNIVAICSGTASDLVMKYGASVIIDYKKEFDIVKSLTTLLSNGKKTILDRYGNEIEVLYPDKKFDLIIDYIGGSKLFKAQNSLLNEKSSHYLTTVGDQKADYRDDKNFIWKSAPILSPNSGSWNPFSSGGVHYKLVSYSNTDVKQLNKLLKTGADMIEQGQLQVEINRVFKMTEIKKAINKVRTQHALGKVLVECEDF